jgi:hypothetical protein
MKKFKFLAAFMMLTMFFSFKSFGQELLPSSKALYVVINEVENLKSQSVASANPQIAPQTSLVNTLTILVGEDMYEGLKSGQETGSVLSNSLSKLRFRTADLDKALAEVELRYRNLLRKPF